jgi:hypothetical protein
MSIESIAGVGQVAEAAGRVLDFAGRLVAPRKVSTPTPVPETFECGKLKEVTVFVDQDRIDLKLEARPVLENGSLAPCSDLVISVSRDEMGKIVEAGLQARQIASALTEPPKKLA